MKPALEELIADGGIMDQYCAETKRSAEENRKLYPPNEDTTFEEEVVILKDWIRARIQWVDENLEQTDELVFKETYMIDGEVYAVNFLGYNEHYSIYETHPEKEGYTFMGWMKEDGTMIDLNTFPDQDHVLTAKYLPDSEVSHIQDIAFSKNCDIVPYNSHVYLYEISYSVFPEDAEDKIVNWTSSNEELASVDSEGTVIYHGPGTFVFTAHLKSGVSRDFTLYVTTDDVPLPESIYPDMKKIHMTVGGQSSFSISTNPSPAKIDAFLYESEDESIVTVGENGLLTAVGPGQTRVHVTTTSNNPGGEDIILETYTTVIVSEAAPPVDPDDPVDPGKPVGPDNSKNKVPYTGDSGSLFRVLLRSV